MGTLVAFPWYGGKNKHLDWLLPLLPPARHYCEPFGGSAAVLLNRAPGQIETYNDLDSSVTTFFRVLQNQDQRALLLGRLRLTPYSREMIGEALQQLTHEDPVDRAWAFFVLARQVRAGQSPAKALQSQWSYDVDVPRGKLWAWASGIAGLERVAQRLLQVQIEHDDAFKVIERYDSQSTLFYVDPPYALDARGENGRARYAHELTAEQHSELASILTQRVGKVALSGYKTPTYCMLYRGWWCTEVPTLTQAGRGRNERTECLWTNYDPQAGMYAGGLL